MTINFQDPRLQKTRQKIASLGPESRAIMNTASQTADFAGSEQARSLKLMQIGTSLQAKKDLLSSRGRRFENLKYERSLDLNYRNQLLGLQEDEYDYAKKQGKISLGLGAASLIPKSYLGYQAYKNSGQTAEDVIKLAKEIDSLWGKVPTKTK